MKKNYASEFASFMQIAFSPEHYQITKRITIDSVPQSAAYDGLTFAINNQNVVYRKGKITTNRPGAFVTCWQRSLEPNIGYKKPIPLMFSELHYLFVSVVEYWDINCGTAAPAKRGIFIFPTSLLVQKGIVSSGDTKGKTGFRVFPPWSQNRGATGTATFSESGKKNSALAITLLFEINEDGSINSEKLSEII